MGENLEFSVKRGHFRSGCSGGDRLPLAGLRQLQSQFPQKARYLLAKWRDWLMYHGFARFSVRRGPEKWRGVPVAHCPCEVPISRTP